MAANPQSISQSILSSSECPVCGCASLIPRLPSGGPDQFACESCGAHFSASPDGHHLLMVTAPAGLPGFLEERPVYAEEYRIRTQPRLEIVPEWVAVRINEQFKPVETAELISRARQLYSLGNSTARVQSILEHIPGVQAEQVKEALSAITEREQERRSTLFWIGIALVGILVVLIGLVVVLGTRPQSSAVQSGEATGLPDSLQMLIGSGDGLLNLPQVKVHPGSATGKHSTCPTQPANAARLFGGKEKMWSITIAGWTLFNSKPQTIRIPEGMSGEYPVIKKNPEWVKVNGPAVLENVIYVTVSCVSSK